MAKDKRNRATASLPTVAAPMPQAEPDDMAASLSGELVEEVAQPEQVAPLGEPSPIPGMVSCVIKHGVLRRNGVDYVVGDSISLPASDADHLSMSGTIVIC